MNGRRDKNLVPEQRRKNRRDTLGRAVPEGFKISRGLNGGKEDDLFPDELGGGGGQHQQQNQQMVGQHGYVETDLDQFMDLDGVGGANDFYGIEGHH